MKTLLRILFFVAFGVCLHFVIQVSPARACSGYPYFGVSNLPEADLLVKATVIDADDSGHNAIIRVEEYYKGQGSRLLTVMRYPPALTTGALVRGYDTGCLYAGRGHRWQKGSQGYFGLKPNGDGTFTDNIFGTAHFYVVDGKISYQEGATEGYALEFDPAKQITEADFLKELLKVGNRTAPVRPNTSGQNFYPLMRFVNITTENGTRYQINPDRSIKKMDADGPIAISPDGAHLAFRADDKNIAFQYIWTKNLSKAQEGEDRMLGDRPTVPGQAANFSGDNNLVAVWDTAHLTIYVINNRDGKEYYNQMVLREVATRQFAKGKTETLPKVMWSANGSTLVWQDANAIWHWNIFDKAQPQQLASGNKMPQLMDISTYGRYVRVGNWNEWRLIDTQTRKEYTDTIASPNELYLITINRKTREPSDTQESEQTCKPPLRENCQKEMAVGPQELKTIHPYEMELIGFTVCAPDDQGCILRSQSWHPAIGRTGYFRSSGYFVFVKDFRAISFDIQYKRPVILVGDYSIYFDLYSDQDVNEEKYRPYLDILDLKGKVDSPIVSVEWGLPVFLDTYLINSNEHRP